MALRRIFSSVKDNIVPDANVTYDLGNTTNQWKDLYLSGNTLNIGGASISVDANSGYMVFIPKPTESEANPKATVVSANGVATVETTAGVVNTAQVTAASSNTVSAGGGGGSGITWQSVQTANVTAVSNYGYPIDTTSGPIYVTLPSSPTAGDTVAILDYAGTFSNNNVLITSSENINGLSNTEFPLYSSRSSGEIVYIDSTQGWVASTSEDGLFLAASIPVSYGIVAGGGAAGGSQGTSIASGGGGGGGVIANTIDVSLASTFTITVNAIGAGGVSPAAGFNTGGSGGNTSVTIDGTTYIAIGGGGGGTWSNAATSGGSGGGAGENGQSLGPGSGTSGQGNAGGDDSGYDSGGPSAGGGGGGAGAAGSNTSSTSVGGNGGVGIRIPDRTGASYFGGGGGGAGSTTAGTGGTGGGGDGRESTTGRGTNGTAGTGGGGGGSLTNGSEASQYGGDGGSGAFVLAYPAGFPAPSSIGGGLTYTANTTAVSGYRVYTFTAGTGNIVFN